MVNDEDLKTHIMEGERCQRHPWTHSSSQVSFDEGFLRAWNPQTRTQRPQLRQRHQQHQQPHLRPPHLPPCQPMSRTHTYFIWSIWTSHRALLASLSPAIFSSGTSKVEGETAVWTADLLSPWHELISSSRMTLFSDIHRNSIRRTWLTSYFMVDL